MFNKLITQKNNRITITQILVLNELLNIPHSDFSVSFTQFI